MPDLVVHLNLAFESLRGFIPLQLPSLTVYNQRGMPTSAIFPNSSDFFATSNTCA